MIVDIELGNIIYIYTFCLNPEIDGTYMYHVTAVSSWMDSVPWTRWVVVRGVNEYRGFMRIYVCCVQHAFQCLNTDFVGKLIQLIYV